MDMEGFAADVTNLRKMLSSIDRKLHEMRLIDRCACSYWNYREHCISTSAHAIDMT